jgi:putative ABC transport system permease protein
MLTTFLRDDLTEEVLGDLDEKFYTAVEKHAFWKAKLNYWFQVINYIRPFAIKKNRSLPSNNTAMLENYFKVGFRNLRKNTGYSIINIGGLAAGMAVAILIGLWVYDELSFDKYHANYDYIAQVYQSQTSNGRVGTGPSVPRPLEMVLRNQYGSDFTYLSMSSWTDEHLLTVGENKFTKNGSFVQVDFPKMFSLKMKYGVIDGLRDQSSIMLSASTALAIFGDKDPINQSMLIDGKLDVKVTGVYEDLPANTTMAEQDFLSSWELDVAAEPWRQRAIDQWGNNSFQMFAQIAPGVTFEQVTQKIIKVKAIGKPEEARFNPEIILYPMRDWHLRNDWKNGRIVGGRIQMVWLFGIIGVFVVLLACINFMNLSTARSEKRAKEVGIRMTIGSVRRQLIAQFLSESFLVVLLSFLFALLIVALSFPAFNNLADKHMTVGWSNPIFWLIGIGFVVLTSLLAGSYPALYLSSFQPVKILKGSFKAGKLASLPRKVLVVMQFTISVTLIIGTIVVYNQIQFAKNRPLGYDQNGLIMIQEKSPDFIGKHDVMKNELTSAGAADHFAEASSPLTGIWSNNGGFSWEGKDPAVDGEFATIWVTHDYGRAIGWTVKKGRDFSREFASDSTGIIINEAAEKFIGKENIVGETINWGNNGKYHVIGVASDMVMGNPYRPVRPGIYFLNNKNNSMEWMIMKLNPSRSTSESLTTMEGIFKKNIPSAAFDYKFVDETYGKKFAAEERVGKLATVFATLAIIISCLGLFGLASFVTEQRTKEIGVRKVMGASVRSLWRMLSKDFVVLVTISCLIAVPTSMYLLQDWLTKFEYRTEISWWVLAISCLGALIVTITTVSYQAVKAALMNPVNSLRSE